MHVEITNAMQVPIDRIEIGTRVRLVDPKQVAKLVESIRNTCLMNPITVAVVPVSEDGDEERRWILVAGAHRLEAYRMLGRTEIAVTIVELGALELIIAECDENLCGTQLGQVDRALLTSRRKAAFEHLHPETRHGAVGVGRKKSRQLGDSNRFTLDVARKTGKAERTVQRDVLRGEVIDDAVLASIRNSNLDRGGVLDELVKIPPAEQAAKVAQLQQQEKVRCTKPHEPGNVTVAAGLKTYAGPLRTFPSAAAVWVLQKLGAADTALLVDMLDSESSNSFGDALRAALGDKKIASTEAQEADQAPCEKPMTTICLVQAGDELEPSAAKVPAYNDCDAAVDAPAVKHDQTVDVYVEAGCTTYEPRFAALLPNPADDIDAPSSFTGLPMALHLRPASWNGSINDPQAGDRCRECRGQNWHYDKMGRGTWRCSGCFEPKPQGFRALTFRTT